MRYSLSKQLNLLPLIISLILVFLILLFPKFLPSRLPLFYSLPWGENQLATNTQMLITPALIVAITLLNLLISWQLHPSQAIFKNILKVLSIICAFLLIISLFKIMLIFV